MGYQLNTTHERKYTTNPLDALVSSMSSSYTVYRVAELGMPRDHHAIFVETNEDGPETGHWFHVSGNVQNGMIYEERVSGKPDLSLTFVAKEELGTVQQES